VPIDFNYLLLSDVHLGSDVVHHVRPWASSSWLLQEAEIDDRLVSFLEHHRSRRDPQRPWKLVIAGDFLDLVGCSIPTSEATVKTKPTPDEERCGMGSAADHVVHKIRVIAARHARVFRALCEFVSDGNSIAVVRGNHDVELHWRAAQRVFVEVVVEHAPAELDRAELAARIVVCPWFFAVEGVLYVEHGHEFDRMCSYGDPLMPTGVRDPRRIRPTPFSVLLSTVARPTKGLSTASYGYVGMGAYVTLLKNLGVKGTAQIAVRFARASYRLVEDCFARAASERSANLRRLLARARLRRFAAREGVSEKLCHALRALYVRPASTSVSFVLRSLYLDRMVAGALTGTLLAAAALFAGYVGWVSAATSGTLAALLAAYAIIGSGRNMAPTERMQNGAGHVAKLLNARWVVMGHTHEPVFTPVSERAHYVNLGSWGADELPDERAADHESSCTFLVVRHVAGDYHAQLMRWNVAQGIAEPAFAESDEQAPESCLAPSLSPAQ
jgi:UDP-2,3-diacylglucosamine pyrophosphatase LpxH